MDQTLPEQVFDLTQPLRSGQPVYPGDPTVAIRERLNHAEHAHVVSEIVMGTHDGTHMDAPYHFFAEGRTLDTFAAERFVGRGVVIDLREAPDQAVSAERLAAAVAAAGGLRPGDFALLWYGWDEHYGDDLMWQNPYLTPEAAQELLDAGVTLVGTDTANVDRSAVLEGFPVHVALLGNEVLIVENLRGLGPLAGAPLVCAFLPLPLEHADAAPTRALAWRV